MCVCVLGAVCVEASLLYIVVFINLRPANREAAVNPGSVKTRCESRGGSNLRTESHRRTHTHTHTHTQRRTGGFYLWRCPLFYSIFLITLLLWGGFSENSSQKRETLSEPLSSSTVTRKLQRLSRAGLRCALAAAVLTTALTPCGHPPPLRSVGSSCPPVMPRSRVGGSACCLGIRCGAWTPSWERASPSTAAGTSPRCPCSPGRSSRWEPAVRPTVFNVIINPPPLPQPFQNKVCGSACDIKDGGKGTQSTLAESLLFFFLLLQEIK